MNTFKPQTHAFGATTVEENTKELYKENQSLVIKKIVASPTVVHK